MFSAAATLALGEDGGTQHACRRAGVASRCPRPPPASPASPPSALGSHAWESRNENGIWTYRLDDVWTSVQASYHNLRSQVLEHYNAPLQSIRAIGSSAMMHGYLTFDIVT